MTSNTLMTKKFITVLGCYLWQGANLASSDQKFCVRSWRLWYMFLRCSLPTGCLRGAFKKFVDRHN